MGYKRITPERIEAYRHFYYDLGWSMKKIADHFGLVQQSVQESMQKNGIAPPKHQKQGRTSNLRGIPFNGCWLWQGWVDKDGYGKTSWEGKNVRIHVAAFEAVNGPVPEGLNVCHTCDHPACYRPDHLFAGSQKENMQDMHSKGRFKGGRKKNDPLLCV